MPRPRQRVLLRLAGLACLPMLGGGFSPQAFLNIATRRHCSSARVAARQSTAITAIAARRQATTATGAAARRGLRRPRAREMSTDVLASMARTPMPPGYEGGKQQRKDQGEEADFNRNVGKVIDTLRRDYPRMFEEPLDFDIYTEDLQLSDPTGVVVTGLPAYQRLFGTIRFFRQVLISEVSTVFRLSYDASRHQVRVCWHFVLDCSPVVVRPMHIDGISIYGLDVKGLVHRHTIETMIVNGTPVKPPFAQAWMNLPSWVSTGLARGAAAPGLGISTLGTGGGAALVAGRGTEVEGDRRWGNPAFFAPFESEGSEWQSLSASTGFTELARRWDGGILRVVSEGVRERDGGGAATAAPGEAESDEGPTASDEGDESLGGDKKEENGDENNKKSPPKKRKKKKKGFWPIEIDGPLGCETSWDCTGGYVCCDLILVKICCSNGVMQPKPGDLIPVLLPIPGRGRTELDQSTSVSGLNQ